LISSFSPIRFRDEAGQVEYFGQPVVMLRRDAIRLIRDELVRLGGAGGRVILDTAGYVSGREEGSALLTQARAHGVKSPESLPAAILTAVEETNMGYGKITIDDINFGTWTFKISVANSFEVDSTGRSGRPTCIFILSYLKGFFSQLVDKDLGGKEVECRSQGDQSCKFWLAVAPQSDSVKSQALHREDSDSRQSRSIRTH
jgi:predicted hydrocarbon binding protein